MDILHFVYLNEEAGIRVDVISGVIIPVEKAFNFYLVTEEEEEEDDDEEGEEEEDDDNDGEEEEEEEEQQQQQKQKLVSETISFCARHDAATCPVCLSVYGFKRHDVQALKLMNLV